MQSTFSITNVTGMPPGRVVASGGHHHQPSANGTYAVVTTGSTEQQHPDERPHLRLVRD
jgi:hypothetical protein